MDEKFRVMPQLDSFYYFEEYLVGGALFLLCIICLGII